MSDMKSMHLFSIACLRHRHTAIALLAGWMTLASGTVLAQSTGNATINVTGTITGATCSLSTSNITIPLGTVDKSVFTGVGSRSPYGPNVALISAGCDASLVSMTFTGTANASNPDVFAVTGGAAGVGIRLLQSDTAAVYIPNSSYNFKPAAAGAGYSFTACYVQTDAGITTGPANTTITVLITYT
jgi:major type 1 subunit fimbrin (pilin)